MQKAPVATRGSRKEVRGPRAARRVASHCRVQHRDDVAQRDYRDGLLVVVDNVDAVHAGVHDLKKRDRGVHAQRKSAQSARQRGVATTVRVRGMSR